MENKKLFAQIVLRNGKSVQDLDDKRLFYDGNAVKLAQYYERRGADALIVYNTSRNDQEKESALRKIHEICMVVDIPVIAGGGIDRPEDVGNFLLTGCRKVFLNMSKENNVQMLETVSQRFGKEQIAVCITDFLSIHNAEGYLTMMERCASLALLCGDNFHLYDVASRLTIQTIPIFSVFYMNHILALLRIKNVAGLSGKAISELNMDLFELRKSFARQGVFMPSCVSDFKWEDLKKNSDGLVPVIVQDYKNEQVLMMAYMNQEAFEMTLLTGRMTYYSRSRRQLWLKGETSGHFQYVKQILIDCDNDTLLAKVAQRGAACHTGNRTCFYRELVKKRYEDYNPVTVFENAMTDIHEKRYPMEGFCDVGLFDQELDQILQKMGEESVGMMLKAKNRDKQGALYQISDYLRNMMLMMDQLGITWSDIAREYKKH